MAITVSNLLTAGDTASTNPYTTGTVTPATNGDPVLLGAISSAVGGRTISSVVGLGLTWSLVVAGADNGGVRQHIWQGIGTASTGTVVVTWSGTVTGQAYSFLQFAGGHLTVPIVSGQFASSIMSGGPVSTSTVDVTNTPAATSCMVGFIGKDASGNVSNALGFTVINTNYTTPTTTFAALYNAAPTVKTVSGTHASAHANICSCEVAVAASTGDTQYAGMVPI
jgi:hypothetical protein